MTTTRLAAWYFLLQGLAVAVWWTTLFLVPGVRSVFELGDPAVLTSFLLPDTAFALASVLTARLAARRHRARDLTAGVTLGAVGYSTLMTCWHVAVLGAGWWGALAMTCATVGTAVSAWALHRNSP